MFTVQELRRDETGHQRLVSESFFYLSEPAVVTVVASLSFMDRQSPDRVTEWRAYWGAFADNSGEDGMDARVYTVATRGSKLPEDAARAIFPHVDGRYAG